MVGFGFGSDDEHINGILRTLIDVDNKKIIVVTLDTQQPDETIVRDIARKLKVSKAPNISVLQVDKDGNSVQDQQNWVAHLA